jgi:hypothetical protein
MAPPWAKRVIYIGCLIKMTIKYWLLIGSMDIGA